MCLFQVKKLVYVYLVRYAEEQQDLALLSISTFQRGLKVCAHKQHFIIFKTYRSACIMAVLKCVRQGSCAMVCQCSRCKLHSESH